MIIGIAITIGFSALGFRIWGAGLRACRPELGFPSVDLRVWALRGKYKGSTRFGAWSIQVM